MEKKIPELYGSLVFNDKVMREKLPKAISKIQYDIVLSNIEKFKIS